MKAISELREEARGITGIGILILFVALVLVAAIASGVILDTAGFLQNKAQATGEDATNQVSNVIQVISATGNVDNLSGTLVVNETSLTVYKAPGAGDIDLEDATIQYVAPNGTASLDYTESLAAGDKNFTVSPVKDDDGSAPVINTRDDRFTIDLEFDNAAADNVMADLKEGESATLRITSQSGATTTYILNVPESLSSAQGGSVLL
jgi:archaellin